jgi:hypothetical protein
LIPRTITWCSVPGLSNRACLGIQPSSDALLAGCGDKAKDLYETAQLEEKQFNKPHATKLYRPKLWLIRKRPKPKKRKKS